MKRIILTLLFIFTVFNINADMKTELNTISSIESIEVTDDKIELYEDRLESLDNRMVSLKHQIELIESFPKSLSRVKLMQTIQEEILTLSIVSNIIYDNLFFIEN